MRWSWNDIAGVILTTCVGVGWTVSIILMALSDRPLNNSGAAVITGIGGVLVGAVGNWLVRRTRKDEDE